MLTWGLVLFLVLPVNAQYEYAFQFGTLGKGDGQFDIARGIALDSQGNVYVTDFSNNRVQKFDRNGKYLLQFGGFGNGDGQLWFPYDVRVDSQGNVYVADMGNSRIVKCNYSAFAVWPSPAI